MLSPDLIEQVAKAHIGGLNIGGGEVGMRAFVEPIVGELPLSQRLELAGEYNGKTYMGHGVYELTSLAQYLDPTIVGE